MLPIMLTIIDFLYFLESFKTPFNVMACHTTVSGKKKAHKHKLFGPVALGTTPGLSLAQTGFVPGTNPLCPGFSPYFKQWKPSLSQGQTQFVPGTIPGTKGGIESLCVKTLCAFFARYSLQLLMARLWPFTTNVPFGTPYM